MRKLGVARRVSTRAHKATRVARELAALLGDAGCRERAAATAIETMLG